jgi:predicted dehydrogenase
MDSTQLASSIVRVGVIGLGFAGETHLKAYQQLPNVQVGALAGLEEDRLAYLGSTYNVPHLYRHYDELLARNDIDAISIGVPNYLHAPIAIAAFEGGKHVLCEKPLARTAEEAEQITRAAMKAQRVLMVVFNQRSRSDVQVLKRAVEDGRLGHIYYAKASWMRRRGIPGMGSWFINKEMAGGGPLLDVGIHVLDMALYLMNEPRVVTVSASTHANLGLRADASYSSPSGRKKYQIGSAYEVEDLATAFLRLADGTTLLLEASWAVHSSAEDDFGVILYGTEGGAEIKVKNYNWQDTLTIFTDLFGVPAEIRPQLPQGEGHKMVVRQFIEAIASGNWAAHTGSEALYRARILDACYASALQGREVPLAQDGTIAS